MKPIDTALLELVKIFIWPVTVCLILYVIDRSVNKVISTRNWLAHEMSDLFDEPSFFTLKFVPFLQ
ncbi:MAG: hypothetical protein KAI17_03345 [Thiotrichaceae bacterium]|nr:hypothetical protein [Thiotrichaceae bacterium]